MLTTISLWVLFAVFEIQGHNLSLEYYENHPNYNLLRWGKGCGERLINNQKPDDQPFGYIMGSGNHRLGEYPWVVLLKPHICAGALISQWWVVSSAQCSDTKQVLFQYLDASSDYIPSNYSQIRNASEIIIHEHYKREENQILHDLLLIRLDRVVLFSAYIQPVCFVPNAYRFLFQSQDIVVAGWGTDQEVPDLHPGRFSGSFSSSVLYPTKCINEWAKVNFSFNEDTQTCEKSWSGGSCLGDTGAPMLTRFTQWGETFKRAYLLGTFIHGSPCNPYSDFPKNLPGIYSTMQYYTSWILDNIKDYPSDSIFEGKD